MGFARQAQNATCPTDRGKRITVVHVASGDLWAGAEVQLYNLANELQKSSLIQVHVVLLNYGTLERRLREKDISVVVFDESQLGSVTILFRLRGFLKRLKPHVVHTHRSKENVLGSLATVMANGPHCLRTVHGRPESRIKSWQFRKLAYLWADWLCGRYLQSKIVAVSHALAIDLSRSFGKKRTVTIENGIDVDSARSMSLMPVDIPGTIESTKIALVGRLVPVKRADIFIKVAHLLSQKNADLSFYLFGDGPLEQELRMMLENLGLQKRVFLIGFKENIPAHLVHMDMLLITSDHEGLPMGLLEAMSLYVPVIAHAVGGIPKVLQDGECGTLIQRQDPEQYALAVKRYLCDKKPFSDKAEKAYQRVQQAYGAADNATCYLQLYAELLGH